MSDKMKIVYLDNNATTRVAPEVVEKMLPFFTERYGNPSSIHTFGGSVMPEIEEARRQVAELIGADFRNKDNIDARSRLSALISVKTENDLVGNNDLAACRNFFSACGSRGNCRNACLQSLEINTSVGHFLYLNYGRIANRPTNVFSRRVRRSKDCIKRLFDTYKSINSRRFKADLTGINNGDRAGRGAAAVARRDGNGCHALLQAFIYHGSVIDLRYLDYAIITHSPYKVVGKISAYGKRACIFRFHIVNTLGRSKP